MRKTILTMMVAAFICLPLIAQNEGEYAANYARAPRFKALLFWQPGAEEAHVQFDKQAIDFFHKLTYGEGWTMDVTTSLEEYPYERLKELTRGRRVTAEIMKEFVESLDLPADDKARLLALTPATYIGKAVELAGLA